MKNSKGLLIGFWIFTGLFCLEMSFTAYWELLRLPRMPAVRLDISLARGLGYTPGYDLKSGLATVWPEFAGTEFAGTDLTGTEEADQ